MKGDIDTRLAMGIVLAVVLSVVLGVGCAQQGVVTPGMSLERTQGGYQAPSYGLEALGNGVEPGKVLGAFVNAFF